MNDQASTIIVEPDWAALDPFEFFPGVAGKINGIGGNAPGHDHNYVLHTGYYEAAPGRCRFIVQFHRLAARRGTLWLRVHMLAMEPGAVARMANSDRIQLNRLVRDGGRTEIRFEGFRGMSFALYVGIQDDTDAEAGGVEVWLDKPIAAILQQESRSDGRSTAYGRDAAKAVTHMLSAEPPVFARPVAQVATTAQSREAPYRHWSGRLGLPREAVTTWQQCYVLQVLDAFDLVAAGARGAGFQTTPNRIAATLAESGVHVAEIAVGDGEREQAGGDLAARQPRAGTLPSDLVDFDFLWSLDVWDQYGSAAAAMEFVERSLDALRPGGLAIHVGGYRLADATAGRSPLFGRGEVERLLLILISRNYEVAQFRYSAPQPIVGIDGGSVGLIIRKPPAIV